MDEKIEKKTEESNAEKTLRVRMVTERVGPAHVVISFEKVQDGQDEDEEKGE